MYRSPENKEAPAASNTAATGSATAAISSPSRTPKSPSKEGSDGSSSSETAIVPAGTQKEKEKALKKFHNGWTKQLENLVAEWADKASCYQWMHQKTEVRFQNYNYYFTIPVIIMSTLTGTANFATNSVVETEEQQKFVTFGIGAISLIAGIISTVANFLRYAQSSEAHRVAAVSWGKFQRFISIELSLHPNERMDAMSFLKMGRVELDRLIEQSPPIPPKTIQQFMSVFKDKKDVIRPEIAGGVEHTRIFDDRDSRLAKLAAEAAYTIQQKKGLMRQLVMDDIDRRIVSRAKEERAEMEEELRMEIMTAAQQMAREVAREATLAALKAPGTAYAGKLSAGANSGRRGSILNSNPRQEVLEVIPSGVVEKNSRQLNRQSIRAGPAMLAKLAAEAAVIGASRRIPSGPASPNSVRIEIVDPAGSVAATAPQHPGRSYETDDANIEK
jgi:hypothetical protein